MSEDNCPICLMGMEEGRNKVSLGCGHSLHFDCFMEYMTSTGICEQKCMLCRGRLYDDNIRNKLHNLSCGGVPVNVPARPRPPQPVRVRRRPIVRNVRIEEEQERVRNLAEEIERAEQERLRNLEEEILRERPPQPIRRGVPRNLEAIIMDIFLRDGNFSYSLKEVLRLIKVENPTVTKNMINRRVKKMYSNGIVARRKVGRGYNYYVE